MAAVGRRRADVSGPVIAGSGPRVFVFPSSPNKASFSRFVVGRAREEKFASSVIYIYGFVSRSF